MCRIVDAQCVVCSYCGQGKKLGIVLAVFDCRKTSLAVGAASAVARRAVVDGGRSIPPHLAGHTARASGPAY